MKDYLFSSRGIEWDLNTKTNPRHSTAIPAKMNAAREPAVAIKMIEAITRNHPASKSKNPKNLIPKAPRTGKWIRELAHNAA